MAGNVMEFNDANFEQEVLQSDIPVLVDFWAEWCGPCKMLAPTIEEVSTEFSGRVKVGKLNVDDNPKSATQYSVMSIPTVLFFQGGQEKERSIGVTPKSDIKGKIEALLG